MSVSSTPFIASPFKTLLVLYLESLTFVYFPANLSSDYDEVCDPWCQQYWVTVSKLTKDNFQNSVSYQPLSLVQQVDFYSSFVLWLFYFYIYIYIYIYIYPKINWLFSTFWSVQWLQFTVANRSLSYWNIDFLKSVLSFFVQPVRKFF